MRSSKSKNWNRRSFVFVIALQSLYPLLLLTLTTLFISKVAYASGLDLHKDPQSYVIEKLRSYDIVFLGTRHKKEAILKFIAGLIPYLHEARTTHLGLEIPSDQQGKIDNFLQTGNGLNYIIELHPQIDCPEYRSLFTTIRSLGKSKKPTVVALDLPKPMYQREFNRDEWMAASIIGMMH